MVKNGADTRLVTTTIRFFGPLEDLVGCSEAQVEISLPQAEASLRNAIDGRFPVLEGEFFRLAVDEEIVAEGQMISRVREISCLPPFAGG